MGCLYRLTFPNGKAYIGITNKTAKQRFKDHVINSDRLAHRILYKALKKYGAAACLVETLVVADDKEYLSELECRAISLFGTKSPHGYNMTDGGEGVRGHTPETLERLAEASRNHRHTPEAKAKVSAALTGRYVSEETKRKLSAVNKGRVRAPDVVAQMSARQAGKTASDETKAKLRLAQLARPKFVGPPKPRKYRIQPSPKVSREEWSKNIAAAKKGKPLTPEHIEAIRAAVKRREAKKRGIAT